MPDKPDIIKTRKVAQSELFQIEQIDLKFSNGELRCFERISGKRPGAVMIIPVLDEQTILLVREYCVGTDNYQLGFPKGLLELGENPIDAANRELMEEVGYGAHNLQLLKRMNTAPGYMQGQIQIVLAEALYPKKLPGDEPEEIEVVPWKVDNFDALLARDDFSEARSIAALYMIKERLVKGD